MEMEKGRERERERERQRAGLTDAGRERTSGSMLLTLITCFDDTKG